MEVSEIGDCLDLQKNLITERSFRNWGLSQPLAAERRFYVVDVAKCHVIIINKMGPALEYWVGWAS